MHRPAGVLLATAILSTACPSWERAACTRDRECAAGEVCYADGLCLRRDLAARAGGGLGQECGHDDEGCIVPGYCVAGSCVGEPEPPPDAALPDAYVDLAPPAFAGLIDAVPDGEGAILVYWADAYDDQTIMPAIEVLVYRGAPGGVNLTKPIATVAAPVHWAHDPGLPAGETFAYIARARDLAGNVDGNMVEVSATVRPAVVVAPGVDFATQVQPIFNMNCVECHGGASGLYLHNYTNVLVGGLHGPIVVPCDPDASNLAGKIGPTPPFGLRMPRWGPPYLTMDEVAVLRQWIADGAGAVYDPAACPP